MQSVWSAPEWKVPAPDGVAGRPRILVIRPRKIGDVVLLTPLLRALRGAFPGAALAALVQPPCHEVLARNPRLDAVWLYPAGSGAAAYLALARRVRRAGFDVVLDAFGTPATARLAALSGAPVRIGFRLPGRAWAYTCRVPPPPAGTYAPLGLGCLLAPLGAALDGVETEMFPGPEDHACARNALQGLPIGPGTPLVALGVAAGQAHKRWPAGEFAWLADALIERWGARILLVHGPGEEPAAAAVRAAMRRGTALEVPPTRTLTQLAALLARCGLFIGNDTGARHVAIAMGVPTVGVFGRSRPQSWTPPDDPRHRTVSFDPGCKSRCTYPRCGSLPCVREITPQMVLSEAEDLLQRSPAQGMPVAS